MLGYSPVVKNGKDGSGTGWAEILSSARASFVHNPSMYIQMSNNIRYNKQHTYPFSAVQEQYLGGLSASCLKPFTVALINRI